MRPVVGGLTLLTAVFLAVLGVGWACLITNCPRGGKRASEGSLGSAAARGAEVHGHGHAPQALQCARCGPGGDGLCVGPGICCIPRFGCMLGAQDACARAAAFPPRCTPSSTAVAAAAAAAVSLDAPCGADLTPDGSAPGRCAAQGVCCTHDSCRVDSVCQAREDNDVGPAFDADLMLTSLRRLIGN